ncbi:MAG: BrnT family toxin [bacterium]
MYINKLEWDDYRIEHIARHNVEPREVWEVCEDLFHLAHREGLDRYRLYGQTAEGRYLFVVLEQVKKTVYKPITARDMTDKEKRNYRRLIK